MWRYIATALLGVVVGGFGSAINHIPNEVTRTEVDAKIETHDAIALRNLRVDIREDMREVVRHELDSLARECERPTRHRRYISLLRNGR